MSVEYSKQEKKFLMDVGNNIRSLRLAKEMSQETFAKSCGLDRTFICDVELGRRNISLLTLTKISTALGVKPKELI